MVRSGLCQLISWTLLAMKMIKGTCRKHSCPFLVLPIMVLVVEHCGTHCLFIVQVSGFSFKSRWHLLGRRLWQISHRLLRSQLCCLMPDSSRLEIITLLPNAETNYKTDKRKRSHSFGYLSSATGLIFHCRVSAATVAALVLYTCAKAAAQNPLPSHDMQQQCHICSNSDTFGIWFWSSTHAAKDLDSKSIQKCAPALLHPIYPMVMATDANMGP